MNDDLTPTNNNEGDNAMNNDLIISGGNDGGNNDDGNGKDNFNLIPTNDNDGDNFLALQNVINQAMAKQNKQLYRQLKEMKQEQEKMKEQLEINGMEFDNLRTLEIKRHRAIEHRYGLVSLRDLGQCFQISIGSKTMGKVLRMVGLAMPKQNHTEPLRSSIKNGYAKSMMYGDFPTYQWNPEKCIERIEEWLLGKGILDEFYSIDDEKRLEEYINNLYLTYDN